MKIEMISAIEKAVYYLHENIETDLIPNPANIVSNETYKDKVSFMATMKHAKSNISLISFFAATGKNDKCFELFENYLAHSYDKLLLQDVNCLYIINRKDKCYCLTNLSKENSSTLNPENNNIKVAILKLDAIYNEYNEYKRSYNFLIPFSLGLFTAVIPLCLLKIYAFSAK